MGTSRATRWGDRRSRETTADVARLKVDELVRRAKPAGAVRRSGRLPSSAVGPVEYILDTSREPPYLQLSYRSPAPDLYPWHRSAQERMLVRLEATEPAFGGVRWWFQCPQCGRRCGVVYLDRNATFRWACRACRKVAYPSQREGQTGRRIRKLRKVLARAGGAFSATSGMGLRSPRPKRMHRQTFQRLKREADRLFLEVAAVRGGTRRLNRMWDL
jgi:hypothetical protein